MQPLESILQSLVCIRSLLILEFYFVVFVLRAFIDKLTNKQRNKSIEGVFLVTYIIVPQNFFKLVDNLIIWCEIAKVLFPKRFYPNLIGQRNLRRRSDRHGSDFHRFLSMLHTWLMWYAHPDRAL